MNLRGRIKTLQRELRAGADGHCGYCRNHPRLPRQIKYWTAGGSEPRPETPLLKCPQCSWEYGGIWLIEIRKAEDRPPFDSAPDDDRKFALAADEAE